MIVATLIMLSSPDQTYQGQGQIPRKDYPQKTTHRDYSHNISMALPLRPRQISDLALQETEQTYPVPLSAKLSKTSKACRAC